MSILKYNRNYKRFPHTRKAKLEEIKTGQLNQAMTGIPLRYKGTTRTEIVWRIPLDYLIYNKYNGRIGSDVLSYEKQNGELNAELDSDREIIEAAKTRGIAKHDTPCCGL